MLSRSHGLSRGVGLVSPVAMVDELWREMDELLGAVGRSRWPSSPLAHELDAGPDVELQDAGDRYVLRLDAPGVAERDVEITYDRGAVTLRLKRDAGAPEGWTARRKERSSFHLSRKFELPAHIDPERATANLRDGLLEIALPKVPAAQPRRLTVRTPSN